MITPPDDYAWYSALMDGGCLTGITPSPGLLKEPAYLYGPVPEPRAWRFPLPRS